MTDLPKFISGKTPLMAETMNKIRSAIMRLENMKGTNGISISQTSSAVIIQGSPSASPSQPLFYNNTEIQTEDGYTIPNGGVFQITGQNQIDGQDVFFAMKFSIATPYPDGDSDYDGQGDSIQPLPPLFGINTSGRDIPPGETGTCYVDGYYAPFPVLALWYQDDTELVGPYAYNSSGTSTEKWIPFVGQKVGAMWTASGEADWMLCYDMPGFEIVGIPNQAELEAQASDDEEENTSALAQRAKFITVRGYMPQNLCLFYYESDDTDSNNPEYNPVDMPGYACCQMGLPAEDYTNEARYFAGYAYIGQVRQPQGIMGLPAEGATADVIFYPFPGSIADGSRSIIANSRMAIPASGGYGFGYLGGMPRKFLVDYSGANNPVINGLASSGGSGVIPTPNYVWTGSSWGATPWSWKLGWGFSGFRALATAGNTWDYFHELGSSDSGDDLGAPCLFTEAPDQPGWLYMSVGGSAGSTEPIGITLATPWVSSPQPLLAFPAPCFYGTVPYIDDQNGYTDSNDTAVLFCLRNGIYRITLDSVIGGYNAGETFSDPVEVPKTLTSGESNSYGVALQPFSCNLRLMRYPATTSGVANGSFQTTYSISQTLTGFVSLDSFGEQQSFYAPVSNSGIFVCQPGDLLALTCWLPSNSPCSQVGFSTNITIQRLSS